MTTRPRTRNLLAVTLGALASALALVVAAVGVAGRSAADSRVTPATMTVKAVTRDLTTVLAAKGTVQSQDQRSLPYLTAASGGGTGAGTNTTTTTPSNTSA